MWAVFQILFRLGWVVALASGVLAAAVRLASLAYADSVTKRRARAWMSWYLAGLLLLLVIEGVTFLRGSNPAGADLVSALRIFGGLGWFGALTSVYVWLPLLAAWRVYRKTSKMPVQALGEVLARFRANPLLVFEEREAQAFSKELKRLTDRRPLFLGDRLEAMRKEFLVLSQEPPKEVCLQRAVEFLKQNRPAEALAWTRRWKADSLEFYLLSLECQAWTECVERLDGITAWLEKQQFAATVMREEVLQILGDLPDDEGVRRMSRERMTENRVTRRRRAILEFKSGRSDVSLKLLANDYEGANLIRAALSSGHSHSPAPPPAS